METNQSAGGKEDQTIDDMNKSEMSVFMHLFHRSSTILGYAVYLSLAICSVLAVVSIPNVANLTYDNGLPKTSPWIEYMLYFGGAFISAAIGWNSAFFTGIVFGLANQGKGYGKYLVKSFLIFALVSVIVIAFFVLSLTKFGLNPIAMEILLLIIVFLCFFIFLIIWNMAAIPGNDTSSTKNGKPEVEKAKKQSNNKLLEIISSLPYVIRGFTIFFYMYAVINLYRIADPTWKIVIGLIIHPLFTEFYLTYFKMAVEVKAEHPFFSHFAPFLIETLLNLFRRFMFNDTNNSDLIVYFTIICGLQEILSRNYMEYKERLMGKLLAKEFPTEKIGILRRRRYLAYSVTSRSFQEITSIIISPMMLFMFQSNRFSVDLGYDGEKAINVETAMTSTLMQLIVELLVIYVCSVLETIKKIPMSDFFFQYRTPYVFLVHVFHFLASCFWVLHSFRTTPNSILCTDINDICSCPSFKVYKARCLDIQLNSTVVTTPTQTSSLSVYFDNVPSVVLSVLGIVSIIGLSILFYYRNQSQKSSKIIQSQKIKTLLDVATTNLMEKSALQQAIKTIESLCRGVSPSQAKLLQNIIEILKNQSKVNNIVDVNSVLIESSEDPNVRNWLREQLMNHDDRAANKNISRGTSRLDGGASSSSSFRTSSVPMDMKKARTSISLDKTNMKMLIESLEKNNQIKDKFKLNDDTSKIITEEGEEDVFNIGPETTINGINDDVDDLSVFNLLSWDFNIHLVKNKTPQSWLAWKCLTRMNLIQELKLPKLQLSNMLLYVEQHYSLSNYDYYSGYSEVNQSELKNEGANESGFVISNPYHNNLHGADVFQGVLYLVTTYEDLGGGFSSFDLFGVLFAAYVHDFNHPGLNTSYMVADWPLSGISSTFGTESPLEKHHLAMTFNLMRNFEEYNFLSSYKSYDLDYFRKIVTECVMSTDLAKSMPWLSTARITIKDKLNESLNPLIAINISNEEKEKEKVKEMGYKILLMQLSIKCADVGHPTRPLEQHLEWSQRICEEFYNQGDKEKRKGMKISPLCDRNVSLSNYPQGQIGFISYVSKPLFMLLDEVCLSVKVEEKPWLKNMQNNIQYWEEKKKEYSSISNNVNNV